jgi:ribonuclease BN (tRNA processing enzyme)
VDVRTQSGKVIIVDAGTGIRELGNLLNEQNLHEYSMLFTHGHWDHIIGFPFFMPLYSNKTKIEIFGCSCAQKTVQEILKGTMSKPNFPVNLADINAHIHFNGICPQDFEIDSVRIQVIPLNHPDGGHSYKFIEGDKSFVFLTDNELGHAHEGGFSYEDYLEFSRGADLLVHDAEYRPEDYKYTKGWGHTVFTEALRLAIEAEVKMFGLFHHNVERYDDDLDSMVQECNRIVKEKGIKMECFGVTQTSEFEF